MAAPRTANAAIPTEPRVLLLTGADVARKAAEARSLTAANADESFADFDIEILDGASTTSDRVLSAVTMIPLGEGKRVVVVRDTHQLSQDDQSRIAAGIPRIPANGLLILQTGVPITEDGKTKRASIVAAELTNAVKKFGAIRDFALPRADDVRGWVLQEARDLGKTLSPDALALFAQLPGDDLQRLRSELFKASCHAGETSLISGADVEATLSRGPDDVIFKLCDAVGARKKQEALAHISTLFHGGSRPDSVAPRVLVLLARQIRLIAQFHYLTDRKMAGRGAGPISEEAKNLLPADGAGGMAANPRMRWMADKYSAQSRNFSGNELSDRLSLLLHADLALKGVEPGGDSPQALMQRLVVELC